MNLCKFWQILLSLFVKRDETSKNKNIIFNIKYLTILNLTLIAYALNSFEKNFFFYNINQET